MKAHVLCSHVSRVLYCTAVVHRNLSDFVTVMAFVRGERLD